MLSSKSSGGRAHVCDYVIYVLMSTVTHAEVLFSRKRLDICLLTGSSELIPSLIFLCVQLCFSYQSGFILTQKEFSAFDLPILYPIPLMWE